MTTDIGDAADAAYEVATAMHWAAPDIACHLTRIEMEALAHLFVACGDPEAADVLIDFWIEAEIEDRECEPGDYERVDHQLVDRRTA